MPLFLTRTPARWVRNCIVAEVDPCDNLTQADWNKIAWVLSGGGFNGVYVIPNLIDGIISSIDSFPDGGYYNAAGLKIDTISYNIGVGYYEPSIEISPNNTDYVLIENIPVTLVDGSSCELDFKQYYNNTVSVPPEPTDEFNFITDIGGAISFIIYNSVGTVDWGDGTIDNYDASGGSDTPAHVLAAGNFNVKVYNGLDTTEIDCQAQGLLFLDLQRANQWDAIDFSNNTDLANILWPSFHNVTTTSINLSATGLSTVDLSSLSKLGGEITIINCPDLKFINFGSSSEVIDKINCQSNDLTGTINISALTALEGDINFEQNPDLTGVIIGSQSGVFDKIEINNCNLLTFDISGLIAIGGRLIIDNNPNLTTLLTGSSSEVFEIFKVNSCDLNGTLDLSGYTGLGGDFQAQNNGDLEEIINPTSSEVFTRYLAGDCDLTGTWDGTGLTGLGGIFSLEDNTSMTAALMPTTSEVFTDFEVFNTAITTLDLSPLSKLGGDITINANPNFTTLTNPTSTETITLWEANSCDLAYYDITTLTFASTAEFKFNNNAKTAAEVNHILVDLDNTYPALGTATINGGNSNAAPDGSSGGFDGITAKNNLIAKGYTVITN